MIGDHADFSPARRQKKLDSLRQRDDELGDSSRQADAFFVPSRIKISKFGPGPAVCVARVIRTEHLETVVFEEFAKAIGRQVFGSRRTFARSRFGGSRRCGRRAGSLSVRLESLTY